MYDPEARKEWLKTENGRIYKAKENRYRRAALDMMQFELIEGELEIISEEAYEYELSIMDDEALIDAFGGDTESLCELRFMFSDLSARCDSLYESLRYANVTKYFDDFFVGIVGNKFNLVGFDGHQEDYFSLTSYETEWAQNESAKRLMRLTKETLLSACGQCFGVAISILDVRHTYYCLTSALELLRGNRMALIKFIKDIEEAYEAAEQRDFGIYGHGREVTNHLEALLRRLPDKVWVS